jgi:hypothetical protein
MKLTQLVATAAVATLLLAGCSTANVDADGNPVETPTANPNAPVLLGYLKGETVEGATPSALDSDITSLWSLYSDEELIAIADDVCSLMTEKVASAANNANPAQDFLTLIIETSQVDIALTTVDKPEDRIKRVAMFDPAAQVYCTEHKEAMLGAIELTQIPNQGADESQPELTELEQLNLNLSEFLSRYINDGIIISEDGLTLNGYLDLDGDNVIEEGESVQTFQLPEGYTYSEAIGTTPAIGGSYSDGNLNDYSTLTVIEAVEE